MKEMLRELAVGLLDDPNGISEANWTILKRLLEEYQGFDDIIQAVEATEGRFYLPEQFSDNR